MIANKYEQRFVLDFIHHVGCSEEHKKKSLFDEIINRFVVSRKATGETSARKNDVYGLNNDE